MRSPDNSTTTEKQDLLVALEQTVCAAHAEVSKAEGAKLSFALKAGEALLEIFERKVDPSRPEDRILPPHVRQQTYGIDLHPAGGKPGPD